MVMVAVMPVASVTAWVAPVPVTPVLVVMMLVPAREDPPGSIRGDRESSYEDEQEHDDSMEDGLRPTSPRVDHRGEPIDSRR
jgi:hypothetical protein